MRGTTKLWRRFRQTALATLVVACTPAPLRRHADAIPDATVRDDVSVVLDALETLRRRGALTSDGWRALCAPLPRVAPDVWGELVSDECTEARAVRDHAIEVRDRLEAEGNVAALDGIDAAVREISLVDDECATRGDDALTIVAAAVRHLRALTPGDGWVGFEGAAQTCHVATLGGAIYVGEPLVEDSCEARIDGVMRGDVLPGVPRIPEPDASPPPPGTYDFEDDLYFAPDDGPFASSPTVWVTVCGTDALWLAQIDGRWLVAHHLHGEH